MVVIVTSRKWSFFDHPVYLKRVTLRRTHWHKLRDNLNVWQLPLANVNTLTNLFNVPVNSDRIDIVIVFPLENLQQYQKKIENSNSSQILVP